MTGDTSNISRLRASYFTALILIMGILFPQLLSAQEPPPRPIVVTVTAQSLAFGAFTPSSSTGSVTVDPGGSRSSGGDVVLLGMGYSYSAALMTIEANPGTLITILNGPDVVLPGSNGGSLTLKVGSCSPASPFVTTAVPPATTPFYVGGTLTVGTIGANPPGNYSGVFQITFVQE